MGTKLQAVGLRMEYYQPRTGGRLLALDNVNLSIEEGEFVTIVGPSGCGKTTFINIADGLLKATGGKILLDGKEVTGPGTDRAIVTNSPSSIERLTLSRARSLPPVRGW